MTRPPRFDGVALQDAALVVGNRDDHHRDEVEARGHEERVAQPDDLRDDAADHRPERRAEPLRRLDEPDRVRHLLPRRRVGRHRQRQRAVAGEQPLDRAQREHCHGSVTYAIAAMTTTKLTSDRSTMILRP